MMKKTSSIRLCSRTTKVSYLNCKYLIMASSQGEVSKHKLARLESKLESMLECPVCLETVRDLPVPCCQAGHIICQDCRTKVDECPTCRRKYQGNSYSSLAANLIDELPHKCKFSRFGCEMKLVLTELVKHEPQCPERTVVCPYRQCNKTVQLRKYLNHTDKEPIKCILSVRDITNICSNFQLLLKCLGTQDFQSPFFEIQGLSRTCLLGCEFFIERKTVFFFIMLEEKCDNVRAKITLSNEEETVLSFESSCLAIETVPKNFDGFLRSKRVLGLPYEHIQVNFEEDEERRFNIGFLIELIEN